MNGAVFDSTFNVFFKLKYARLYDAMLATPLGPRDVAVGEISWSLMRGALYSAAFLSSRWSPAPSSRGGRCSRCRRRCSSASRSRRSACSRRRSCARGVDFDYVTLAIQPMFLFSATFFPLSTYPASLQWVVQATPLYHGVALERGLMLGEVGPGLLWHVLYLAVLGGLGVVGTARRIERLLLS